MNKKGLIMPIPLFIGGISSDAIKDTPIAVFILGLFLSCLVGPVVFFIALDLAQDNYNPIDNKFFRSLTSGAMVIFSLGIWIVGIWMLLYSFYLFWKKYISKKKTSLKITQEVKT